MHRDLAADLHAKRFDLIGKGLHSTWTSLPDGIEQGASLEKFRARMQANTAKEADSPPLVSRVSGASRSVRHSGHQFHISVTSPDPNRAGHDVLRHLDDHFNSRYSDMAVIT